MHQLFQVLTVLFVLTPLCSVVGQPMTNDNLEKILYVVGDSLTGNAGNWQFEVEGIPMFCITDASHDRMRIICPVRELSKVTSEEMRRCMEANFHTVLDVRYATSRDILWVAFIHPLTLLSKQQVIDAVSQLYHAALNFGSTYNSTNLSFPKTEDVKSDGKTKKT